MVHQREQAKVAILALHNGRFFTFRILTRGVEAGWTPATQRSSTHARTCLTVGCLGSSQLVQDSELRQFLDSASLISCFTTTSSSSLADTALCASWAVLPTHIMASPWRHFLSLCKFKRAAQSRDQSNLAKPSHLSPQPRARKV